MRILVEIGELNISEIARRAGLNYATTNQHLEALENYGLIQHKKFGRIRIFRFNEENAAVCADVVRMADRVPVVVEVHYDLRHPVAKRRRAFAQHLSVTRC